MHTEEDEAKTKWCPFARTADQANATVNRGPRGIEMDDDCLCLASGCMAWRWVPLMCDEAWRAAVVKATADIKDASPSKTKAAEHVNANRAKYGLPTKPFSGYCGLAGNPKG